MQDTFARTRPKGRPSATIGILYTTIFTAHLEARKCKKLKVCPQNIKFFSEKLSARMHGKRV